MADSVPASTPMPDASADSPTASPTIETNVADSILAYGGLYVMAILCIYIGSKRSVQFVKKHIEEGKLIENSISDKDARMFPITASGVLFSLYLFFKYGDQLTRENIVKFVKMAKAYIMKQAVEAAPENADEISVSGSVGISNATANATGINLALSYVNKQTLMTGLMVLICFEGTMALASLIKPLISKLIEKLPYLNERGQIKQNLQYEMSLVKGKAGDWTDIFRLEFDTHDLVSIFCVAPVGILHVFYGHWITNDIIGLAFSIFAIESLHLCTFKGGCMLLAGLFVYDVFWVFATDVMTTVATGIKAPILLQFPQDLMSSGVFLAKKHAMLGLGDIVIPGVFLAMLLRFDEHVNGGSSKPAAKRFYFSATMFAYAGGLVLTIGVMHWFKAAQPALLYLVPACVGVPLLLALVQGEIKELCAWSEEHLVQKDEDKDKKDN